MRQSKEEKIKAWEYAINMNQIDGPWEPSEEFKELIEREINEEITIDDIRKILTEKYTQKYLGK